MADEYELTEIPAVTDGSVLTANSVVFGSVIGQAAPANTPPDVIQIPALAQFAAASDQQSVLLAAVFN